MRKQPLPVCALLLLLPILLLPGSSALGRSYDMTVHLSNGESVTIPIDDVRCIEFANLPTGVPDPMNPTGTAAAVFQLLRSYPNPFNPSTTIVYETTDVADVTVRIFDLRGSLVAKLLHETQAQGRHQVTWDGTDDSGARVSSGVYFCMVECGEQALSQQLILVK